TSRPSVRAAADRQVGGPGALDDAPRGDAELTGRIGGGRGVTHQPPAIGGFTHWVRCRDRILLRQPCELPPPGIEERVGPDEQCLRLVARQYCESTVDLATGAGVKDLNF